MVVCSPFVVWDQGPSKCSTFVLLPSTICVAMMVIFWFSEKIQIRETNKMFSLTLPIYITLPVIHTCVAYLIEKTDGYYEERFADTVFVTLFSMFLFLATKHKGKYRWHTLALIFTLSRINFLWLDMNDGDEGKGTKKRVSMGFDWTQLFLGLILTASYPARTSARRYESQTDRPLLETSLPSPVDLDNEGPTKSPEETSGWISYLLFGWLSPLVSLAYHRQNAGEKLLREDLPPLQESDRPVACYAKLEKAWDYEVETGRRSFTRALLKAFTHELFVAAILKLIQDCQHFINPVLMSYLLQYISGAGKDVPEWHGWAYAIGMCVNSVAQSIIMAHYFQAGYRSGMHVRAAVIMLIFNKSMKISPNCFDRVDSATPEPTQRCCICFQRGTPSELYHGGPGQITNLITADTDRYAWLAPYFNLIWSAPLQTILCFGFLWRFVGWSFIGSLIVMALTMVSAGSLQRLGVKKQKEVMVVKDERLKVQTELLNAVKIVKIYGWEDTMQERVTEIRNRELRLQMKFKLLMGFQTLQFWVAPVLVAAACFFVFIRFPPHDEHGEPVPLSPEIAFPTLLLFNILSFPLGAIPFMLNFLSQAQVSTKRIQHFLAYPDVKGLPPITKDASNEMLELEFKDLTWPDGSIVLHGPEKLSVARNEFVVIVGPTGCGKSALISAFIGEMTCPIDMTMRGEIRLVSQTPWIRSVSLKENIIGSDPFNEDEYRKALECTGLIQDVEALPDGDETMIGNRGVTLSGGQRVRVSLARAVYNLKADIFIFDDILSAVDVHVGRLIVEKCINKRLKGKSVILATHCGLAISSADRVIHVENNKISYNGNPENWTGIDAVKKSMAKSEEVDSESPTSKEEAEKDGKVGEKTTPPKTKMSMMTREEETSQGAISWNVYKGYFNAAGGPHMFIFFVIALLSVEVVKSMSDFWLTYWTKNYDSVMHWGKFMGIAIYSGCAFLTGVFVFVMIFARIILGQSAAKKLHMDCQYAILRASMSFIDVTPTGQIINRLSQDTVVLDNNLAITLSLNLQWFIRLVIIFATCALVNPLIFITFIPILWFFNKVQKFYVPTARDLRRLDSTAKGPVFSHFGEILNGLPTVRAHRLQDCMSGLNIKNIDAQMQAYFLMNTSNRWLSVRMQLAGALLVSCTAIFVVIFRDSIMSRGGASIAGLAVTYALRLTDTLNALNRESADREAQMVCAERLMDYVDPEKVPPEAALRIKDVQTLSGCPKGALELKNICVRYRPDLPLVLDDVSLSIEPGTSLGICGRTGAGKSSVFSSILRLVELDSGQQLFDGVDISKLGLHDLRSNLLVVPQDPVLFSGTVKFNLDPFNEKPKEVLWDAVKKTQLDEKIEALGGLDGLVEEGGGNFSHGERQLLALARALVRKTDCGILLLDEATSSLDANLDQLIQTLVAEEFHAKGITVISIAHRIQTIINYDRVAVFDEGKLVEFGSPSSLIETNGIFASFATDATKSIGLPRASRRST